MNHKYIPSRLVRYADMGNYKFKYIEAPRCLAHNMAGVPVSEHEFGVIVTDRFMLETAIEKAGLRRWTADASTGSAQAAAELALIEALPRVIREDDD